jgi:hypothetical protein
MELLGAAEDTFTAHLSELIANTLTPSAVASAATALSALRDTLERGQVGMPAG